MVERSEKARLALVDAQAVLDEKLRKSMCIFSLSLHVLHALQTLQAA